MEISLLGLPGAYPTAGPGNTIRCSLEFIGMSLGCPGRTAWPYSALIVLAAWLVSGIALAYVAVYRPEGRVRAIGMMAFAAALCLHALLLGWGRGGADTGAGFAPRYITRGAVLVCWIYLAFGLAHWEGLLRKGQLAVFAAILALLPFDARDGIAMGRTWKMGMDQVEVGARSGMSSQELAARYWRYFAGSEENARMNLEMLRAAGFAPYRGLPPVRSRRATEGAQDTRTGPG